MKIRPMGAELYHKEGWTDTDGQTDTTKLIFAVSLKAPKKADRCAELRA